VSHPPEVTELLASLGQALASRGERWYVFGAQAVVVWGRPRTSADVDVTAAIELDAVPDFIQRMAAHDFRVRAPDPEALAERARVVPFLHAPTGLPLDVVLAGPGLEQEFLDRAVEIDLGRGVKAPVITAEDLVIGKILAGRSKDLEDVRGIVRQRLGRLDLERVRTVLTAIESALSRGDLLPVFEVELRRAESERAGESEEPPAR